MPDNPNPDPLKSLLRILPLLCYGAGAAHAVVISAGDGSGNTSAPADDPGFANIGTVGGGSAVYLGNGWVLTAAHVAGSLPASVQLGGTTYSTAPGTFHQLTNNGTPGVTTLTDTVVFRLASDPGLPWLNIRSSVPTVGDTMTMIGNGYNRATSPTYWDSSWAVLPSSSGAAYSGYTTTSGHTIRWGENQVAASGGFVFNGTFDLRAMISEFNADGLPNEAQAVVGDSGGGVFIKNGSTWELAGMTDAVGGYSGQPDVSITPIYGDVTAMSDLSYYRDQIISITDIPEPSAYLVAALALPLMAFRRKR